MYIYKKQPQRRISNGYHHAAAAAEYKEPWIMNRRDSVIKLTCTHTGEKLGPSDLHSRFCMYILYFLRNERWQRCVSGQKQQRTETRYKSSPSNDAVVLFS